MGQVSKPSARRANMKVAAARAVLLWAMTRTSERAMRFGVGLKSEAIRLKARFRGPRTPKGPVR